MAETSELITKLKGIKGGPLAAAAKEILDVVKGLEAANRSAINFAAGIKNVSDGLGVSAKALQEFRFAGRLVGKSTQETDAAFTTLVGRMAEMKFEGGKLNEFLGRAGDRFGGLKEKILAAGSTEARIKIVLDAMAKTKDQTDRTALSLAAFGRIDMTNLVKNGGLNAARERMGQLGNTIDEKVVKKAANAKKAIVELSSTAGTVVVRGFLKGAEASEKAARGLAEFAAGGDLAVRRTEDLIAKRKELFEQLKKDIASAAEFEGQQSEAAKAALSRVRGTNTAIIDIYAELSKRENKRTKDAAAAASTAAAAASTATTPPSTQRKVSEAARERGQARDICKDVILCCGGASKVSHQPGLVADPLGEGGGSVINAGFNVPANDGDPSATGQNPFANEDQASNGLGALAGDALAGGSGEGAVDGLTQADQDKIARAKQVKDKIKEINDAETSEERARQDQNLKLWKSGMDGKLQVTAGALGQISALMQSENKTAFKIGQAAAIGETIINTYKAATGAYSSLAGIPYIGPALGIAAAAAAVAAGIANIQKIKASKPGGSASRPAVPKKVSSGGASASAPPVANVPALAPAQSAVQPRIVNLTVASEGGVLTDAWVRESLIPTINEAVGDGVTLNSTAA